MNFSHTEENYLKHIYHLQQEAERVSTNQLAGQLQTKPASVTDMLKKLHDKSLVAYRRYQGFQLTDRGETAALHIIRRHRLWEHFLATKLGFAWTEVHALAEQLEHVSSEVLINKLDAYLGYPKTDPHGDPIPDANGRLPALPQQPLTAMALKQKVQVCAVTNQSAELLEMLNQLHIKLGARLEIRRRFDFDGSLEVLVNRRVSCILPETMARHLQVTLIGKQS